MMARPRFLAVAWFLASAIAGKAHAEAHVEKHPRFDRAQQIVQQMSVEQKVGQVIQAEIRDISPSEVRKYAIGSILNGGGSHPRGRKNASILDWVELADEYFEAGVELEDGTQIAPIWGTDAVHGHNNVMGATLFPHNIGLGAGDDLELVEKIAAATAREVRATGIDWIFAPTVAVAQDYRWGRTYESFHSEADRVSAFGAAVVRGFEGEGVLGTAKHFIGDGATRAGVDQGDVRGSLESLASIHSEAYEGAFKASVPTVMASFNSISGKKIHGSKRALTDYLRGDLGFAGMVVSDWNGVGQVADCTNASCAQAFNAGIDMIMVPHDWREFRRNMLEQVASGAILMSRLDEAVTRIISMKLRYGLIDGQRPSERSTETLKASVGSEAHRRLARDAVRKSLVLLKNDKVLPIDASARVAVVGEGADNISMQSGGWSLTWQGRENNNDDFPGATSIRHGIKEALTAASGEVVTDSRDMTVDVAIVVFGEQPYAEGQGDVGTLVLRHGDYDSLRLMRVYREHNIPVVAVFISGRPMWVNREINLANAFVAAWLPGSEGGGIADLLVANADGTPRYEFTGKLPFDWPMHEVNAMDETLPVDVFAFKAGFGLTTRTEAATARLPEELIKQSLGDSESVIFRGGTQRPWANYVGDPSNWLVPVSAASVNGAGNDIQVTNIDVQKQEDARLVRWTGAGQFDSQFFWKTPNDRGVDFTEVSKNGGALSVVLNLTDSPAGKVSLRMDCVWPCSGRLDITKLLKRLPTDQWVRLSFPLACFEEAGVDMGSVNAPFVLVSSRKMTVSVFDVAIVNAPDPDSVVRC